VVNAGMRYDSKLVRLKPGRFTSHNLVGMPPHLTMWTGNHVIRPCMASRICSRCGFLSSHPLSVLPAKIWVGGSDLNIPHVPTVVSQMKSLYIFYTVVIQGVSACFDLR
jgi:hypothetical protein